MASIISAGTTSATALNMSADTTGILQLAYNNGTIGLTINASGNYGFATTTVATNFRAQFLGTAGSNTSAASSGTTQSASAVLRLQGGGGFTGTLDIGQGGGTGSWLQSCDTANLATTYPLLLNPVGGNVGIGTASPSYQLTLENSSNFSIHLLKTGSNDGWVRNIGTMDIAAASGGSSGQSITFSTGANYAGLTTRAMIDGSGNMMFRNLGSTAPWDQNTAGQGAYAWLGNSTYPLGICNNNNIVAIMNRYQGSGVVVEIKNGGTVVGSISHNGTNTAYNTSSDYRLKHSVQPMSGALAKIAQLKPVTYKWNADNSDSEGFIAHELAEVFPGAVTGEKDALKEDGSINPQGIDTSFLVATLTAAIQELNAKVTALENK